MACGLKRRGQGQQVSGSGRPVADPAACALQVVHSVQRSADIGSHERLGSQLLNTVEPRVDLRDRNGRALQPGPDKPAAHGRARIVHRPKQTPFPPEKIQSPPRGRVHLHEIPQAVDAHARYLRRARHLGLLNVGDEGPGGPDSQVHAVGAEAFERRRIELPKKRLPSVRQFKVPARPGIRHEFALRARHGLVLGIDALARRDPAHLLADQPGRIVAQSLRGQEFSSGSIACRKTYACRCGNHCDQEVVDCWVDRVCQGSGGDHAHDLPAD